MNFLNKTVADIADRIRQQPLSGEGTLLGFLKGGGIDRGEGTLSGLLRGQAPGTEDINADAGKPRFEPALPAAARATPEQEARARAAGFPSWEAYVAWTKRSQEHSGGTVPGQAAPSAQSAMDWHPANIFRYITDAMRGATGQ